MQISVACPPPVDLDASGKTISHRKSRNVTPSGVRQAAGGDVEEKCLGDMVNLQGVPAVPEEGVLRKRPRVDMGPLAGSPQRRQGGRVLNGVLGFGVSRRLRSERPTADQMAEVCMKVNKYVCMYVCMYFLFCDLLIVLSNIL